MGKMIMHGGKARIYNENTVDSCKVISKHWYGKNWRKQRIPL